jgi:hypothetical protein
MHSFFGSAKGSHGNNRFDQRSCARGTTVEKNEAVISVGALRLPRTMTASVSGLSGEALSPTKGGDLVYGLPLGLGHASCGIAGHAIADMVQRLIHSK